MLSSLREYLSSLAGRGTLHSEGQFTVDPARAAQVMGLHAMPSPWHHLLKVVQVANRVGAETLHIQVKRNETRLEFQAPSTAELKEASTSALSDTAGAGSSLADDLSLALLGAVGAGNPSASWSLPSLLLSLDSGMVASRVSHPETHTCAFTLRHNDAWRFWRTTQRKVSIKKLLDNKCAFSSTRLWLDGKELPPADASFFNAHLRAPVGARVNIATGVLESANTRVPTTNLLFSLSSPGEPSLALTLPSQEYYTLHNDNMVIFTKALEPDNEVRPDGVEVCAWMLQFVRDGMRVPVPEQGPFSAVIAFNIHGPGNNHPPRLKIVRHGVLAMDSPLALTEELEPFRGCSLLLAHDGFHIDASGFQIVEDDDFVERLLELGSLVDLGHAYFEEAADLVHLS